MLLNIYYDNDSDIKKSCENIRVHKKESLKYALKNRIIWQMSDKYDELEKYVNIKAKETKKEKEKENEKKDNNDEDKDDVLNIYCIIIGIQKRKTPGKDKLGESFYIRKLLFHNVGPT